MNCDRCRELASEALDGALSGSVLVGFRKHVDRCPPCGAFLVELRDSLALLTGLPEVNVDADRFDRGVWDAIRESERAAANPAWRAWLALPGGLRVADLFSWRWAPVMAVGTAALVIAVALGPDSGPVGSGSSFARSTPRTLPPLETETAASENRWEPAELSIRAPMPEPVEQYLQQVGHQVGQDLRLGGGTRLRGSDYIYPVRRLEVNGESRVGTPVGQSLVRPVSADPRPSVIAF